jgi:hypothetical protein
MEQPVRLTGIAVLETVYASTFAQFHFMIGLILLGTRFLTENLTLHEKKTAFNA